MEGPARRGGFLDQVGFRRAGVTWAHRSGRGTRGGVFTSKYVSRTDGCFWGASGLWGSRGRKGCGDEASVLCKVMGSHGRYMGEGGPCGLCILGVSPRVTSRTTRGERKGERRQESQRGSEWSCQTSCHTQISSLDIKDNSTQASSIIHTPRAC